MPFAVSPTLQFHEGFALRRIFRLTCTFISLDTYALSLRVTEVNMRIAWLIAHQLSGLPNYCISVFGLVLKIHNFFEH